MVPKDFYYFVVSGFVLMLIPLGLIAWFQAGFFFKWLKARASRGKGILIKIRGKTRDHFATGKIIGDYLLWGKKRELKRVLIDRESIYTSWGVQVVDIDEATNNPVTVDYKVVPGFDAERYESLYIRALYRPALESQTDKILLVLLIIVIFLIVAVGFLTWNVSQQVAEFTASTVKTVI